MKPSRLLAEAAAGRFFDLQWEAMKGRSAENGGVPGIALLESEVGSGVADGDTTALRGVVSGRLPEKGSGGDAAGIAEFMQRHPQAAETLDNSGKNAIINARGTLGAVQNGRTMFARIDNLQVMDAIKECVENAR